MFFFTNVAHSMSCKRIMMPIVEISNFKFNISGKFIGSLCIRLIIKLCKSMQNHVFKLNSLVIIVTNNSRFFN